MDRMRPKTRLGWIAVSIVATFVYAVLVAQDPGTASALMLGYVGLLLTIFVANEIWKKPNDRS
jgi:hypothetical protein